MRFEIVAERENETVRMKRNSSLARLWASEGWNVIIVLNSVGGLGVSKPLMERAF
jgi:hypothetical protein